MALIIEDQVLNIRLLTELLKKDGYTNINAIQDSREGIETYKSCLSTPSIDVLKSLRS